MTNMNIYFHVFDRCNMKCINCHWFSENIKIVNKIKAKDIIFFLNRAINLRIEIETVFISGGEPTLWVDLTETINNIPKKITDIIIFTNGSFPKNIKNINRNICLRISIHNGLDWVKIKECINLAILKKWEFRFVGYESSIEKVKFPKWFKYRVVIKKEQIKESKKVLSHLTGKKIECQPRKIYFGTDGRAYFCEKGLRTKDDKYAEDFTLWEGEPKIRSMICKADNSCISNIINEQEYKLII